MLTKQSQRKVSSGVLGFIVYLGASISVFQAQSVPDRCPEMRTAGPCRALRKDIRHNVLRYLL